MVAKRNTSPRISVTQVAGLYIGTVIGAGFASGQETLRFFGLHGRNGLLGLACCTVLFAFYGWLLLELGYLLQARSHREVVFHVTGPLWCWPVDMFMTVSLLAGLTVMLAGAGAALAELLGVSRAAGSAAMAAATVVTVLLGIHGVVAAVSFVSPFLIASLLWLCFCVVRAYEVNWSWARPEWAPGGWWPLSAAAYVSYNLVLSASVLAPAGALARDDTVLRRGAALGGAGLGLCATAVLVALRTHVPMVAAEEVPMLYVIARVFPRAAWLYTALLLAEIYTTAVASLYGFAARLTRSRSTAFTAVTVAAAGGALLASRVGFSRLVGTLYAAMGYVGAFFLLALTAWFWRRVARRA